MKSPYLTGAIPSVGRVQRRPQHPFYLYQRPFVLQPFLLAPVLPGETLKSLMLQARAVSDPILNPLSGWWLEYYVFYVKLRDLEERDSYTDMMLDPAKDMSALAKTVSAEQVSYTAVGGQKWVEQILETVTKHWFRDRDEAGSDHQISASRPFVKISQNNWMDSLMPKSALTALDVEVADISAGTTYEGSDDKIMASELDSARRHYEFLRENGLVQMDYEDYLGTFGIKTPQAEEDHRPELIRYVRDWTYPTNVVEPTTGAAKSAVSWAITEKADKARFFKEPGFIFGVTCARPKVFLRNQLGSMAGFLDNAFAWLPAIMSNDPATSLRAFAAGAGPVPSLAVDSVADMRDLFLFGEQFVNIDPTTAEMSGVSLPPTSADPGDNWYPTTTDADALFVTVSGGTSGTTKYRVRQDGLVSLHILGSQRDSTPRGGNIVLQ